MALVCQVFQDSGAGFKSHFKRPLPAGWRSDVKPHRQAKSGQVLTFSQGTRIRVVRIKALGVRRGPASEAALLYDDLAPVMPATENNKPAAAPAFEERQVGGGRPTKRPRRETDRLKAGIFDSED